MRLRVRTLGGYRQFWDEKLGRWVYTHRRVVEKRHGKPLPAGKVVHHRNGNRLDNRPANLRLVRAAQHPCHHPKGRRRGRCPQC